jgi:hypothetical protein
MSTKAGDLRGEVIGIVHEVIAWRGHRMMRLMLASGGVPLRQLAYDKC